VSSQELKNPEVFRPDLLYRLNTVEIRLPPLRERSADIPLLANAFVREYTRKYNRALEGFSNEAMSLLMNYRWPGNVRELRYSVERAVILADGDELGARDFISLADSAPRPDSQAAVGGQTLDDMEKASIEQALRENQGNISHAAKTLGLTRASLYRRIEKFGI
jgi:DNA-binding NtrC family response regulator